MRIKLLFFIALLLSVSLLAADNLPRNSQNMAASNTELYAYRFIVELYELGDPLNLAKEIVAFKSNFPDSRYLPYIRYIEANLALDNGELPKAQEIYESLLKENLSQEILGELLLNYALSKAKTGDPAAALILLQRVDSEIADPELSKLANLQRGDIYFNTGQYYSAERAYQQAYTEFPDRPEIAFLLFNSYVKLGWDSEALGLLTIQDKQSSQYENFMQTWLNYLLSKERYQEFDAFCAETSGLRTANKPTIVDLRIRRALREANYRAVKAELGNISEIKNQFAYYTALLMINDGNEAEADSILRQLVSSPVPEVAIPAYLERLKLLYKKEPLAAIVQLNNFIAGSTTDVMKAELYYTLGYFSYHKEDYPEAIKQLSMAKRYDLNRELSSRVDILTAEAWFATGRSDLAMDAFNRYLNLYQEGKARDRAWFYLGFIHFVAKDYARAKPSFTELINLHSTSGYLDDAYYYLAEIDFYLANYNLALQSYQTLLSRKPDNSASRLRVAQIYYYLEDYQNTAVNLADLQPSYEVCILKGSMFLAQKEYSTALDQFLLAESFAVERLRKAEAQSYRAMTLYHLKRFREASTLYLQLSSEKESPDTYMFLAAKSAYAARDYHQALELYNGFIEQYPESGHFLSALAGIANAFYNMGNYNKAVQDWINLLSRFRNKTDFTASELAVVKDAILGLELGMKRLDNIQMISELIALPDTFVSQYIRFELNYLLVKLYADNQMWADLIQAAEKVKSEYPEQVNEDIQLMMATGLIELNQIEAADTLLAEIYGATSSNVALLKWAELELMSQNFASALEKYRLAYQKNPQGDTWFKMLQCSQQYDYYDFDAIWDLGASFQSSYQQGYLLRMEQLYIQNRREETLALAEFVLNNSLSTYDHARAFLILGKLDFASGDFGTSIGTFRRVLLLFPEYNDVCGQAVYYTVQAQILIGALPEAEMFLNQHLKYLETEQINELSGMIRGNR